MDNRPKEVLQGRIPSADATLEALIQFVDEALIGRSRNGVVTMWGSAAQKLFGYTAHEIVGQPTEKLFGPAIEQQLFGPSERGDIVYRHAVQCQTRDGGTVLAALTVLPVKNAVGDTASSLIIATDVVAQTHREEAQHFLAALVESADDAIISKTLGGIITSWNRGAEKLFGYTASEMIGQPITKIFPVECLSEEPVILERLRRGEGIDHYETQRMTRDGRKVDVSLTVSPIRDNNGTLIGASKIARDITYRKHIETRERNALQQAQALNRAKDEFIATISHELRTPMTAILGWIRMLKFGDLNPEVEAKAITVIERNAKAQAQLIEELLDSSRIVSGKLKLNIKRMDLASVIHAVMDALRPASEARQVTAAVSIEPGSGTMLGDAERLQQVVWNLVSNAIKFTSKDGRVEVRLERRDYRVHLSVADTGVGISSEFLPYVFNRFSQADSSLTRTHGGLGMGLSIVKSIVELHGGSVSAASEGTGKGSVFSIELPVSAAVRASDSVKGDGTGAPANAELTGMKILVVDDDSDTCEMVRHLLERCGAAVSTATSASEALQFLQTTRIDLLISDISMPAIDGYELIRRVRAGEAIQNSSIPAVALTALARIEDRLKALAAGYQMHLAKPVEPRELVSVVTNALSLGNKAGE